MRHARQPEPCLSAALARRIHRARCLIVFEVYSGPNPYLRDPPLEYDLLMLFDDILDALDVRLDPFALCEVRGETSLGLGRRPHAVLHYVLAGQGTITVDGYPAISAAAGSMVLIPAFSAHSLHASGTGIDAFPDCRPLDVSMEHLRSGAGTGVFAAICGRVSVVYRGLSGTMDLLRAPIIENLEASDPVHVALRGFVAELASPTIGTRALARTLLLQCIILLFRRRMAAGDPSMVWLHGLSDEALWGALRDLLDRPALDHTVDTLAEKVGMSRANFANRFRSAYGVGPIDFLRSVRLRRAAELLVMSDLPVKRIARMVGYESRTYFSRAFKDEHGAAPDAFRKTIAVESKHP